MSVRMILSDMRHATFVAGEGGGVGNLGWGTGLRPATAADEPFLFDVFSTTWQNEVAALPDPTLVRHFLRIQYTAQNTRFQARFPGYERWIIEHENKRAGRFFVHRSASVLHIVEITLMPEFRSTGIGSRVLRAMMAEATERDQSVSLRVPRRNVRAARLYDTMGFELVTMDDQDSYFEWTPPDPARG